MVRKLPAVVLAMAALTLAAPPSLGDSHQIEDPAGDHPVPFMDLTGVGLALVTSKTGPALEVTFTLSGAVSDASRSTMTGYSFTATVGKCDLLVRYIGYPDGVFASSGFASAMCGGRDAGGTSKISDDTITVTAPLQDLKGVEPGATMTDLYAFTSPGEGMYHDDTTAPSALGDAASSDQPWTIG